MTDDTAASELPQRRRSLIAAGIVIGILALTIAAASAMTGVRLFSIQTPSMGETAPVGSLVVTQPQAQYDVGEIVTFTIDDRTVTHRIVGASGGTFTTRGDMNGSTDGWSLSPDAVIGRVVLIAPGAGFALTAAPWLLLGAVLTEAVTWLRRARAGWLWSVRFIGWSTVTTAVSLWLRPWFNVRLLDYRPAPDEGVLMHIVNTGILPVMARATRLVSGQDASVLSTDRLPNGAFTLAPVPDPSWPVRLLLIAACLLPFLGALLVRPTDPEPSPTGLRLRPDRRGGRVVIPATILTIVTVVVLVTVSTSTAAFSATVRNSADVAGTNPFFTCRDAESYVGPGSTWAAYRLSGTGTLTEGDFSGNGRTGTYAQPRATVSNVGCTRDAPQRSVSFTGSQCLYVPGSQTSPNVFSIEAWFQTSSTSNGRIMGFSDGVLSSNDGSWDRLIYLDATGRVVFGIFPGTTVTVASPAGQNFADGAWHHVVATLSSAGMTLYVDGALVGARADQTAGQNFTGTWKIGCGQLRFWTNGSAVGVMDYDGPDHFTGLIQYAAIYTRALSADEVRWHYAAGR
ncbi:hypothetical protein NS220_02215 [Microbacterium testaceum]|uniref:LamG-like jellyroll fold domain-containing protein n=1 Tax=Microbacterium testaceum TaxID=2033 RepID=A0A147F0U2_MICTE|nr:LamG-like jellyroll fold domain-containing protein [Microbacterium testaceum]KTR96447.1 hypothetical protein NS220_02215 [Microbacterium testaceum]